MEVARERERQMAEEGWTPEHDDKHDNEELAYAAACYAMGSHSVSRGVGPVDGVNATITARLWPWSFEWWKPKRKRHNLIRAAALIVAEIERLDRAAAEVRKAGHGD
jgi:hypothetical protein